MKHFTLLLIASALMFNASAKNIYVSKSGKDSNNGTENAPYLTIKRAAQVAYAGDVVLIGDGTYEETLTPLRSGTSTKPIIFKSVPGEKVVITAMQKLSGWTKDSGVIYKTTVNWDLGQSNFVMNGATALDLARWPNNTDDDKFTLNSLRNDGGSDGDVSQGAFLTDSDIPDWDWEKGGSLLFYGDKPGSGWTTWKAWITGSSNGRVDFNLEKNQSWIRTFHAPKDKGDYYLEGIKQALDYKNEWFFDSSTKTLYVQLPYGAEPRDGEVKMSRRTQAINLKGKSYIEIHDLAVFGGQIEIEGTGNKLYRVSSFWGSPSRGITKNFNCGVNAVNISWNANNTVIEKCEIGFGDGSGIWDSGAGTLIKNCYVHDFNTLGMYDAPIMIRGRNNAKLLNSTVTRGGRDALQIISKGSEVAYNDFSYSNLIADDCALLYTIGANLNMDIHHNWLHDAASRGSLKKAAGIYLDNSAGDVRVYRNVVWNTEWTGVQINWDGTDLDIFNNTFYNNSKVMGAWHKEGTAFTNVNVWNNLSNDSNWEPQSDKQNNLTSTVNMFVDRANGDFRLKDDAPAIDYGRLITNYTEGFKGAAPDAGAYELGDDWVPGIDWDYQVGPTGNGCYGLPGESCVAYSVNELNISQKSKQSLPQKQFQLSAEILPVEASNTSLEWTSTNENIATVDAYGLVTTKALGNTLIIVKEESGKADTCALEVTNNAPSVWVEEITISPRNFSININETKQLAWSYLPIDADNTDLTWLSRDERIASVNSDGLVTGIMAGTVMIIGTTSDGVVSDSVAAEVPPLPSSVECSKLAIQMAADSVLEFQVPYFLGEEKDVAVGFYKSTGTTTWIAEGQVTHQAGEGTATVTVRVKNKNTGEPEIPATGSYIIWAGLRDVGMGSETNSNRCYKLVTITNPVYSSVHQISASQVEIYPNPALNTIRISDPGSGINEVRFYTLQGKECLQLVGNAEQYDISVLPKSTYLVKVVGNGYSVTKKLVKIN